MTVTPDQLAERKRWVRALISGDYVQGTSALRRLRREDEQMEYCCLGVYQHQLDPEHLGLELKASVPLNAAYRDSAEGTLDEGALDKLGWTEHDQEAAYELNDHVVEPWTFEMIARGIGYSTANDISFYLLRDHWDEESGDAVDAIPVPDDFDLDAWLAS